MSRSISKHTRSPRHCPSVRRFFRWPRAKVLRHDRKVLAFRADAVLCQLAAETLDRKHPGWSGTPPPFPRILPLCE